MSAPEPRLVDVGRGGCWHEGGRCDEQAIPGGYYCSAHLPSTWTPGVPEGGGEGRILVAEIARKEEDFGHSPGGH